MVSGSYAVVYNNLVCVQLLAQLLWKLNQSLEVHLDQFITSKIILALEEEGKVLLACCYISFSGALKFMRNLAFMYFLVI